MKKSIDEIFASAKKAVLTPKTLFFIAAAVVAFVIHPLVGLIAVGIGINFLMSVYTSKGVLEKKPSEDDETIL